MQIGQVAVLNYVGTQLMQARQVSAVVIHVFGLCRRQRRWPSHTDADDVF